MATMLLISSLPKATQDAINTANAIPSSQRLTPHTKILNAYAGYVGNEVVTTDSSGNILTAAGNGAPVTAWTGFKKGALYINKADGSHGAYLNTGDETSASWQKITSS